MSLPQDIQVPVAMVIGLLGFLIAIGAFLHSKNSNKKTKVAFDADTLQSSTPKVAEVTPESFSEDAPSTPPKKEEAVSTPTNQKTGSIQTPAGRRSARLAKRRKED